MRCVFDLGMHNGDDTAYYLHKGYRVVAVEANPAMVELAQQRFAQQIRDDRLEILNVGIAAARGEQEFYVSLENSVFSSFDKDNATKGGGNYRSITVPCIRFRDLVEQYGTPYYVKIDIEGNDRLCLRDLDVSCTPSFISFEMSHADTTEDIDFLAGLGYSKFKCIRQNDFLSITPENMGRELRIRGIVCRLGLFGKVVNRIRFRKPRDGIWRFPKGSSGMFGDDLVGPWLSLNDARAVWRQLRDIDPRLLSRGLTEWFDVHARLPERTT